MGPINWDRIKAMALVNALSGDFDHLQSSIQQMVEDPNFTSATVLKCIRQEANLLKRRAEQTPGVGTNMSTALVARAKPRQRLFCTHCRRPHHTADFCIAPGGKYAGHTIEEAQAAQRAALNLPARNVTTQVPSGGATSTANVATSDAVLLPTPLSNSFVINGITYSAVPSPAASNVISPTSGITAASALCSEPYNTDFEFSSFVAMDGVPTASVDWNDYSRSFDFSDIPVSPVAYSASKSPVSHLQDVPFILDSGASFHISPERSDFKSLRPITPHPVKGFGGSCVYAIGMGSIELQVAGGKKVTLDHALFVPNSCIRLVSVFTINRDGHNACHFDSTSCCVTNSGGAVVLTGTAIVPRRLYALNCISPSTVHKPVGPSPAAIPSAHYAARVPDVETWHRRLGHCNNRTIIDMARQGVVTGMPIDLSSAPPACDHCILGKQTRSSVPKLREGAKATRRLERVFVDLCGPLPCMSRSGHLFSLNIIDDFSSYVWSIPVRAKSDAAIALQNWHRAVENQSGEKLKILVSDNGELVSKSVSDWCSQHGIDHQLTAPHTSAQNGRAERLHRTILGKARAMRLACNAPAVLWDEFCATSAYLTNLTGTSSLQGRTPFELWSGHQPSLAHLREIGCRAFALVQTHNPKLYRRSTPCILIGYAPRAKAYRLWDTTTGKVFNSFHVTFVEHLHDQPVDLLPGTIIELNSDCPPSWDTTVPPFPCPVEPTHTKLDPSHPPIFPSSSSLSSLPQPSPTDSVPTIIIHTTPDSSLPSVPDLSSLSSSSSIVPRPDSDNNTVPCLPIPAIPPLRRSARIQALRSQQPDNGTLAFLSEYAPLRNTHDLLPLDFDVSNFLSSDSLICALADGSAEPDFDTGDDPSWAEAMHSPEREYWVAGARDELRSLSDLRVFVLIPRADVPPGRHPLKGKLVCKRKRDESGKVVRYKVRYVAKGYAQQYGVDYDKTTAPTARLESFRTILHLAASLDWDLQQIDIKTAFLHGILPEEETAYMEQPRGFEEPGKETWVMKLMRSIYGMKQASRIWNQTFHAAVTKLGFTRLDGEHCVYRRETDSGIIIFAVHVDDILSAASSSVENDHFKEQLKSLWDISDLGPAKYALGIAITRHRSDKTISISQSSFIDRVVDRFGQSDAQPADTPMVAGLHLQRPDKASPAPPEVSEWAERTPYRELVGSLNYIAVATRPDIAYAVGRLASFLDCYRPEHWSAAIRILRYLKGTRDLQLVLGGRSSLSLVGHSDSDYANCKDTSRSIAGYCFSLSSGMVSWSSKKQEITADSSCYAEYIALHESGRELLFLRQLLDGLGFLSNATPSTPNVNSSTPLFCDNDAAVRLTQDYVWHSRVKHIRVKFHSIRELVRLGDTTISRVNSADNIADILTKPLGRVAFERLRLMLGLRPVASS
jgi:transposase InsO family protein